MDGGEGDDQARPGVQGVVVEDREPGGDSDRHKVLESAHSCVDLPLLVLALTSGTGLPWRTESLSGHEGFLVSIA